MTLQTQIDAIEKVFIRQLTERPDRFDEQHLFRSIVNDTSMVNILLPMDPSQPHVLQLSIREPGTFNHLKFVCNPKHGSIKPKADPMLAMASPNMPGTAQFAMDISVQNILKVATGVLNRRRCAGVEQSLARGVEFLKKGKLR